MVSGDARALTGAGDSCTSCLDIHLGDYNLFLLEDYTGGHYVGGKVAAGGNITLSDFTVGSELSAGDAANTLVAGGELTLARGGFPGNAWYGGASTHTNLSCEPTCAIAKGTPIDFAARFAELRDLSSRLATYPINGKTWFEGDGNFMMLKGEDPCLNVFEVNASDLDRNSNRWSQWDFKVPAGSFVVLNIRGTSLHFSYVSTEFNGSLTARHVLYNFVDATHITGSNVNFQGTLLAPKASVAFESGSLFGGLYAVSLSGAAFNANANPLVEMTPEEVCKTSGTTCGSTRECHSGECVDGVCCNTACEGACDACNQPDHLGTCTPVFSGSAGSPSCAPYVCGGSSASCPTTCTTDSQCIAEDYCGTGACVPKLANGAVCTAANQCGSGNCVDGVCCNTACGGECDACNLAGHEGTCSPVPSTVQCRGAAGECDVAEYCTGTGANCPADGFQSAGTACTSDSNVCTVDVCNGTGSCGHPPVPPETSCGTSYGAWGSCSGFSDYCDTTGTQSRTVTASTCGAGMCGPSSSSTETQECTRAAPNTTCAEPSYGEWSACSYSDTCAQTGTQRRTVKRYTYSCATGLCAESTTTETQACTRNTEGVQCRAAGVCDLAERCSGGSCPADSKMSAGTSCDDGRAGTTGDRCDGAGVCTGCGDGVRNGPEACDDGNTVTETSCPNGQTSCTVCNASCTQVLNIQTSYCGDGVTNGSETCDYGNNSPCSYGQSCVQCNTSCTGYEYVQGGYCGDGVMNGPEACDYGNNSPCPYGQSCVQCNTSCTGYQYAPGPSCGDGVTNGPEACDYGNNTGCPYGERCLQCNTSCTGLVYGSGGYCGDGVTNGPEVCDYGNNSQCNTSCTGLIPPPQTGVCSSSNAVESLFIGWYQGYLHRCADAPGLAWWVEQYSSTTDRGCGPFTNVNDSVRNSCFLTAFLDAARGQGEYP